MAKQYKALFLLLSVSYLFSSGLTAATTVGTSQKALNFIKLSCKSTTYSDVCIRSLSAYANTIQTSPKRLVETALAVTLNHAQSTKLFVSHLKNRHQFRTLLQDCAPSTDPYCTDESLTKTIKELKLSERTRGESSQFLFHMSEAQAWASLTCGEPDEESHDVENTCSAKMKSVKARLVNLRKETSNVMSLFKAFAKN